MWIDVTYPHNVVGKLVIDLTGKSRGTVIEEYKISNLDFKEEEDGPQWTVLVGFWRAEKVVGIPYENSQNDSFIAINVCFYLKWLLVLGY